MTSSSLTARSTATRCSTSPRTSLRPASPGARRLTPASRQGLNNVFAYEANAQEGGYVNGVIAALLSQSDVLGVVGPVEAGDAKLYIDGFVNGAKATKPDIGVNVSYTGSFGDTALAAEAATPTSQPAQMC